MWAELRTLSDEDPRPLRRLQIRSDVLLVRPDRLSYNFLKISADNADSIGLDYMDIDDIADIGDTDGDGKVFDTAITITDLYGYQIHVSDRIHIKRARIRPAVSTGEELEPELVYCGETLRPGVDYIWEKERFWNQQTFAMEAPAFVEPGSYIVVLYGKGRFTGRIFNAVFSIVGSEEAAQALVDQAQAELSAAQTAMKAAIGSGSKQRLNNAYARLINAQNALADAQAILEKEKNTKYQEQIAQLEQQIEDLNDQMGRVSVVDISNYAVTMKTSFTYTGKVIRPAVKVSGLNSACYTVSYVNNTKVGTARVIRFTSKGQGAKTYARISGSKKIKINKKTGKVTVKKGLKKGTYKVRVRVTAGGSATHMKATKMVTFKVKVR